MYEKNKLLEAEYFLEQMNSNINNGKIFIYNLNAFLASARSVLQYLLEEIKVDKESKQWYDKLSSKHNTLKFIKEQRDFTIHERPVNSNSKVKVEFSEHITAAIAEVSVKLYRVDENEKLILVHDSDSLNSKNSIDINNTSQMDIVNDNDKSYLKSSMKVETEYMFNDWDEEGDILDVCKLHLIQLNLIIDEAVKKGYIEH